MKKFTKALAMSLGIAAVAGAFAPNASAQALPPAACATCSPWTLSPDGALAFGGAVAILGGNVSFNASTLQTPGVYGAGFTFNGGTVIFDADLYSFDYAPYDTFIVTMSTSGYYWTDGLGSQTFTWSGNGTSNPDHYVTAVGGSDFLTLVSESTVYVSFVMETTGDNLLASQGSFHVNVNAIPEPETYAMLLAGLGLMGFVARRRKLKLATA